ncbi:MAG: Hpt domain-containing protein [Cellvibrionaceae bacterium]
MTEVALDLSVLESMFGDDAELRGAILEEFKHSSIPYMAEFDEAVSLGNAEGVKSLAHKLKSSSRTVGACPLGDLCEQLESKAPQADWQEITALGSAIKVSLEEVITAIDNL